MIPKIKEIKIPLLKLLAVKSPMTWDECTSELSKQFQVGVWNRCSGGILFVSGHKGQLKSHYAIIGMAFVSEGYPLYYDAVNEKGLGNGWT